MLKKIKEKITKPKDFVLTIKGYYLYKYCKSITEKTWKEKDFNQFYEDALKDFGETIGFNDSRDIAAQAYVGMILNINPTLCDELIEIGINNL